MADSDAFSQVWLKRSVIDMQPVVRTSKPYPLILGESFSLTAPSILGANFRRFPFDLPEFQLSGASVSEGAFRSIVRKVSSGPDEFQLGGASLTAGEFRIIRRGHSPEFEEVQLNQASLVQGNFKSIRIEYLIYEEAGTHIQLASPSISGGSFVRS